ncbi:ABC transporter ATP-binding protein [Verrucomicrobia bacterium]|nr:ABC transporter ATP-binding protein [Verrucomicrobiota bacterium]
MADNPVLNLENVSKSFPSGDGTIEILQSVSLQLSKGESAAIVGPSGSGKSTLLNIIGTLDLPTSGNVKLSGLDIPQLSPDELAALRNKEIGFIFQSHHLLPQCSVLENILTPSLPSGSDPAEVQARARNLIERVGLTHRINHRPGQLSGGEKQRAAVVRALINQPSLLLADEPTGALDHDSAVNLCQLLVELNTEENVTLIVVTHAQELASRMQRVFNIDQGRLIEANQS